MFTGTLRKFQEEAVDRIFDRGRLLVAYQMGLGKTVVTICAVEELVETGRVETGLVVVPASLKYQWARKIEEFTGEDNYVVIDGTPAQRAEQYERARRLRPRYVILNYEKVRDEWPVVSRLRRDYVVTDEATVYKGFKAKVAKRVKRLQPDEGYAIALTGQPIENRPEDLFSIMQHVDEPLLGRWDIFDKTFIRRDAAGRITKVKNLPLLWDLMNDAMVRKTRHDPDVAPYMPQVEETVIPVELDRVTAKVYRAIVDDLLDDLEEVMSMGAGFDLYAHYGGGDQESNALRGQIMSKLTALRMLCDHPDLVRLSARLYMDDDTDMGSEYAYQLVKERGLLDSITRTPKMSSFLEAALLNLEESPKTKLVVFSTFKPTLRWLQEEFLRHNRKSVQFTGDMNAKQKDVAKQKFNDDPYCRLFLSSDAGGYGVDLPNANYLKNYDLCVQFQTRVLTADLRWVQAGSLKSGDLIVGCEEERRGGRGFSRRWQVGEVLSNKKKIAECVRVTYDNGDSLVVTPDHRMLTQTNHGDWGWIEAQNLRPGWRASRVLDQWRQATSFEAGWLAGMFDGEGCVGSAGPVGLALSVAQNEGLLLKQLRSRIRSAGFDFRESKTHGRVVRLYINGGVAEQTRFLGVFQPHRLIIDWQRIIGQHVLHAVETPCVVSVEFVGLRQVSVLNTTSRTYIAEGYVQHNCWSAGRLEQRNARIIRLSSDFDKVHVENWVIKGSVQERQYDMLQQKLAVASAMVDRQGASVKGELTLGLDTLRQFLLNTDV